MVRPTAELSALRSQTAAFIGADWSSIILHTRVRGTGDDEGMLLDGPDRPAQRMRLIPQGPGSPDSAPSDGTQQSTGIYSYVLLGNWNSQIEQYDWWLHPTTGQKLEVRDVLPYNGYEVKGLVDIYDRSK